MSDEQGISEDFRQWWQGHGRFLDPDTEDVPWYDKRQALAELAWGAGNASLKAQLYGCELAAHDYAEAAKYGEGIGFGEEMKAVLICRESLDAAIARYLAAEQALAVLETQWWVRLGKFRMALDAANLHGHYNLLQEHFEDEAGKWEELLTQLNASQQQVTALEARIVELTKPVTDEEWERYFDTALFGRYAEPCQIDALLAARAALKGA